MAYRSAPKGVRVGSLTSLTPTARSNSVDVRWRCRLWAVFPLNTGVGGGPKRKGGCLVEMGGGGLVGGHVVDARLPSGAEVRVRVAEDAGGIEEVGLFEPGDLEVALGAVGEVASVLHEKLSSIRPRRATVEFGVSLSVKAGKLSALVFDGGGEASLRVALEWEYAPPAGG